MKKEPQKKGGGERHKKEKTGEKNKTTTTKKGRRFEPAGTDDETCGGADGCMGQDDVPGAGPAVPGPPRCLRCHPHGEAAVFSCPGLVWCGLVVVGLPSSALACSCLQTPYSLAVLFGRALKFPLDSFASVSIHIAVSCTACPVLPCQMQYISVEAAVHIKLGYSDLGYCCPKSWGPTTTAPI